MDNEQSTADIAFTTMQTMAKTIGTQMLTIKLHERAGSLDLADTLRKQNVRLEEQLDKMIDLYYRSKDAGLM
jgi:hypothetical protein